MHFECNISYVPVMLVLVGLKIVLGVRLVLLLQNISSWCAAALTSVLLLAKSQTPAPARSSRVTSLESTLSSTGSKGWSLIAWPLNPTRRRVLNFVEVRLRSCNSEILVLHDDEIVMSSFCAFVQLSIFAGCYDCIVMSAATVCFLSTPDCQHRRETVDLEGEYIVLTTDESSDAIYYSLDRKAGSKGARQRFQSTMCRRQYEIHKLRITQPVIYWLQGLASRGQAP